VVPNTLDGKEGVTVPGLPDMRLPKLFGSSVEREQRIKYSFKNQVVEAIRISYELVKKADDHEELCRMYVLFIRS
jgi:hypothetical protein